MLRSFSGSLRALTAWARISNTPIPATKFLSNKRSWIRVDPPRGRGRRRPTICTKIKRINSSTPPAAIVLPIPSTPTVACGRCRSRPSETPVSACTTSTALRILGLSSQSSTENSSSDLPPRHGTQALSTKSPFSPVSTRTKGLDSLPLNSIPLRRSARGYPPYCRLQTLLYSIPFFSCTLTRSQTPPPLTTRPSPATAFSSPGLRPRLVTTHTSLLYASPPSLYLSISKVAATFGNTISTRVGDRPCTEYCRPS